MYQNVWIPEIGQLLECVREPCNSKDPYAIAVLHGRYKKIVGHLPRKISAACSVFLRKGGQISCFITAPKRYSADLPQGGLEVPCSLKFNGKPEELRKLKKLVLLQKQQSEVSEPAAKKAKMENTVEDMPLPKSRWIQYGSIKLDMEDKNIISKGGWLNDKHMDFAQAILRSTFKDLTGLRSTLISGTQATTSIPPSLQIVHTRGNHWIVVTTLGSPVGAPKVFDSLYETIDQPTLLYLASLYCSPIKVENGPKQFGTNDCGVFAIATATLLANGGNPEGIVYNQTVMRNHLIMCFENFKLSPFPCV